MDKLKNIEINDIVPIGGYEALPVNMSRSSFEEYPNIVLFSEFIFDTNPLLTEFYNVEKEMLKNYFIPERKEHLINSTEMETKEYLASLGFTKSNYRVHSLREMGTQKNNGFVGQETGRCLAHFQSIFRQQYMVAEKDLVIAPHVDNKNMKLHGFRVHIPFHPYYIGFEVEEENFELYCFDPGKPVFINFCKRHFVLNPTGAQRVNLAFQLSDDKLIIDNMEEKPEPIAQGSFQDLVSKWMN